MFDHVSIAVADLARAEPFYDAIMAVLGWPKVGREGAWLGYGLRADSGHPDRVYLSVLERPGTEPRTGLHWCFKAPDRGTVEAFWRAGLAAGGQDRGPPGPRPLYHAGYYAAFLSDPDGNLLEAVHHGG